MHFPLKGLFKDVFRTAAPIVVTLLVTAYLGALSYYQVYFRKPEPVFNFYNTSLVKVHILPNNQPYAVQGTFNNVIEGQRKIVQSGQDSIGFYSLPFEVNSPRPATVYIEGEAIDIFIIPDSILQVEVKLNGQNMIENIHFKGATANICEYYREKNTIFDKTSLKSLKHTTTETNLTAYSHILDSITQKEDEFIVEMQQKSKLPTWFVDFERNELLYEKAYLKLMALGTQTAPANYFDPVAADKKEAVFSYYYYLYVNTLISQKAKNERSLTDSSENALILRQLAIADTMLKSETHDVYITRSIFAQIQKNNLPFAKEMLEKFGRFKEQRYLRFLKTKLK